MYGEAEIKIERRIRVLAKFKVCVRIYLYKKLHRTKLSVLKDLILNTLGGLDRVVSVPLSEPIRLFLWTCMYALMISFSWYLSILSIESYASYAVMTAMNAEEADVMNMPAVTICNANPFKNDICEHIKELCSSEYYETFNDYASDNETKSNFENLAYEMAYSLQELVIGCTIRNADCMHSVVPKLYSEVVVNKMRLGVCYCLFCEKNLSENILKLGRYREKPAESRGLNLMLNASLTTYLPSTASPGFIIMVHPRAHQATVNKHGVFAPPGETTYVKITRSQIRYLPPPYESRCTNEYPYKFHSDDSEDEHTYDKGTCETICVNLEIIRRCGCKPTMRFTDLTDELLICSSTAAEQKCRAKWISNPVEVRRNTTCQCPNVCEDEKFDLSVSRAAWQRKRRSGEKLDLVRVVVYFETKTFGNITQIPQTSFVDMVTSVGGNINTFPGLSALLLFEYVDVLLTWVVMVLFVLKKQSKVEPEGAMEDIPEDTADVESLSSFYELEEEYESINNQILDLQKQRRQLAELYRDSYSRSLSKTPFSAWGVRRRP